MQNADPIAEPAGEQQPRTRRQRFVAALPLGIALLLIAVVWGGGAVWSFEEQTAFARANGFHIPELLPLVLDGMAVAMAAVAYAASLDARPAVMARLGTALSVACSAASNIAWAWERTGGDEQTIALAGGVPVVANVAFEVLLSEIRRQVLRRRGQPGPVAIAYPRMVRLALAPWPTFTTWRRLVLAATDPAKAFGAHAPVDEETRSELDEIRLVMRQATTGLRAQHQVMRALEPTARGADEPMEVLGGIRMPAHIAAQVRRRMPAPDESVPAQPATHAPTHDEPRREPARESSTDSPATAVAAHAVSRRAITATAVREPARESAATQRADDRRLNQAYTRLTKRLGREPSGNELAAETGISKATANRWKSARQATPKES